MAAGTNIETLKKDSANQLKEAREELGEEFSEIKEELRPKRLAHVAIERHKGALIVGGLAAGLVVSYFLFRPRRPVVLHAPVTMPVGAPQAQVHVPDPESTFTGKVVGGLVKLAAPFLIKALVTQITSFRSTSMPTER